MTKTQNFVWFLVPLVLLIGITILTMIAIHASIQMPIVLSSVTWNSEIVQKFASVTWNSMIIPMIC
jgi:hypothetical protein